MRAMTNLISTTANGKWVFPVLVLGVFVGDSILNGKNGAGHFEHMQQECSTHPDTSQLRVG
jgi:hypothetical protein